MNELDTVKNKIAKMFALSESNNVNEAQVALKRANDLMMEWNLTLSDIDLKDEKIIHKVLDTGKKRAHPAVELLVSLGELTSVKVWIRRPARYERDKNFLINFLGYSQDVDLIEHYYNMLVDSMDRALEHYKESDSYKTSPIHGRSKNQSFMAGFVRAVYPTLREMIAENEDKMKKFSLTGSDLVVIKDRNIENHFDEEFGIKLRSSRKTYTRVNSGAGYNQGKKSGSNMTFSKPVNGGQGMKAIGNA